MELRADEISKIIKAQIQSYEKRVDESQTGRVLMIGDGIARASGLNECAVNELIEFPTGVYGMALNLEESSVAVVMLGEDKGIEEGNTVERTGRVVSVPVGEKLIGRAK